MHGLVSGNIPAFRTNHGKQCSYVILMVKIQNFHFPNRSWNSLPLEPTYWVKLAYHTNKWQYKLYILLYRVC